MGKRSEQPDKSLLYPPKTKLVDDRQSGTINGRDML